MKKIQLQQSVCDYCGNVNKNKTLMLEFRKMELNEWESSVLIRCSCHLVSSDLNLQF